ncbi:MAG: GTP-binding protein [Sulfurimonas sp.]|uniref:putative glycoside hydrolase n=1 Tax=Sulfurimonas sp. TaxID=2022749 RepID=UPI002616BE24|nr:putative glycoside hydrolase [Sulfurimonas sp.]MCW8895160.1 GTP-binding protein [Sulfurimonas sp.]MCW8954879.1 GTP-binding protein [Sulfurimonas sp.]MCW9067743.1 GTP-binding protein [Sulfurimonas sp.]
MKPIFFITALLQTLLFASFTGSITDGNTSKPIYNATISDSHVSVKSDENGSFTIDSNETTLHVKACGYRPYKINTENNNTVAKLEPLTVKALYLSFWRASNNSPRLKELLNIIDKSEINTIVVDVKNEYGSTSYLTSFEQANSYGAHKDRTNRDIHKFMKLMKSKNIYTIARIVTFKDELQASNNQDYAIKKPDGTIWRNHDDMAWVDPYDKRAHEYTIMIAQEAAKVGFDEINFDYIRFPARSGLKFSKENTQKNRIKAISDFLILAQNRLRKYGVFISVDTYGNICWSDDDNNIGQTVTSLAAHADYLAPMLYPSGFASGSFYFDYPAEHPHAVVYRSIKNIKDRIDSSRVRPWLQYFKDYSDRKKVYRKFEINEQIRATEDVNTSGWMMWSPSSKYHLNYFIKEGK